MTFSIGQHELSAPVVLAPMAGVTNAPFRALCRHFAPGLVYVNEMVMATPVVHANAKTHRMISFADDEHPRSQQIYGSDPDMMGEAVHRLCDAGRVDHIDINFGCPAAKVTRRGGGAAVPARPELLRAILRAAVSNAAPYGVPVTAKFRMGLFDDWLTHLRTGEVCAEEGVASIAMHARTVEQHYSGEARWEAIGELKAHMTSLGSTIPVLGNGDIWEAHDAVRMMAETDCDGVVIGRGCLGRPWLFADLVEALNGRPVPPSRTLGEVVAVMAEHARGLAEHLGEDHAMRDYRKHTGWYMSGYPIGSEFRRRFSMVKSLAELDDILGDVIERCGEATTIVEGGERIKRGHTRGPTKVSIPEGWLDGQQREALATDVTVPDDDQAMAMSGG
ncbi:tRNA dihydrouridine synthase DusB [Ilumatobacter coccineus]|uniref:tRNA-dihydrouridine synthase n=1 Tax=Ilumatobacter coccineus (strain NBRC 103263 / KCTC 29153 / YM16-304) TaxID=1313172 RepID=A0A6C7E4V5_ILUCY|nr:tRNA dihydrouridine synthase DusB [Ilumatobacter coccineus]BAN01212.1 tRNA-dihydrouridine synthase [Ilumatobacter coccineus YM16-304]